MLKTVLVTLDAIPAISEDAIPVRSARQAQTATKLSDRKPASDRGLTLSLSHQVLDALQHLALGSDSQIILSHIIPRDRSMVEVRSDRPPVDCQGIAEDWKNQLQHLQAKLPCPSQLEVAQGDPAEEIIRLANIYHADLIVMGCRGLVGIDRIVSRSVSAQVAEESPCSIWVVKPH